MKFALYGGSFDPPHAGHIAVVNEALRSLPIERLIIVPAYKNPFKSSVRADGTKRSKWLKAIFKHCPNVEISDFEIRQQRSVYTIETVEHFASEEDEIYLIIGADNLQKLSQWHRFDELNRMVTWVVATREGIKIPDTMMRLDVNVPLSSTALRHSPESLGLDNDIESDIIQFYKETNESTN